MNRLKLVHVGSRLKIAALLIIVQFCGSSSKWKEHQFTAEKQRSAPVWWFLSSLMNRWFVAVGATGEWVHLNRIHWNSSLFCGFVGADFQSWQIWSQFEGRRRTRSFSGKQRKFKKHDSSQGHFADSRVVFLKELVLALRTGNVRIRAFWVRGIWTSVAIIRGVDKLDAGAFSPVFVAFMREDVAQKFSTTDPEGGSWSQNSRLTKTAHEEWD